MDLLFSQYASPFEFMRHYMRRGEFGEFVNKILEKRRKQLNQEEENKLWELYIHSFPDKSFNDWKAAVLTGNNKGRDENLTERELEGIIKTLFKE